MVLKLVLLLSVAALALVLAAPAYASGYGTDGYYYTDAEIDAIISATFDPADWGTAHAVAYCESGYVPTAYGPALGTVGLFQISGIARVQYGLTYWDVDTPYENAFWADVIQDDLGWGPWACAY